MSPVTPVLNDSFIPATDVLVFCKLLLKFKYLPRAIVILLKNDTNSLLLFFKMTFFPRFEGLFHFRICTRFAFLSKSIKNVIDESFAAWKSKSVRILLGIIRPCASLTSLSNLGTSCCLFSSYLNFFKHLFNFPFCNVAMHIFYLKA